MSQPAVTLEESNQTGFKHVLTFLLDDGFYGVDICNVSEVLEYCEVTRVPRCPSFMAGVINLRGHVVPVINLRSEFELDSKAPDVDTCIIIFDFPDEQGTTHMLGCIVDSVSEVLEISCEQLAQPPKIGNHINPEFIDTIAKIDDRFVILLNMHHILSQDQLNFLSSASSDETTINNDDTHAIPQQASA